MLIMAKNRLQPSWLNLERALKTGNSVNEFEGKEDGLFELLYSNKDKAREFMNAMASG